MATFDVESDPFQFCPECRGRYGSTEGCWRCGGRGVVEPYDPFEPRFRLRNFLASGPGGWRVRGKIEKIAPEVPLP